MKKKNNKLIFAIITLLVIFGIMIYFYLKPIEESSSTVSENIREIEVGTQTIENTITGSRRSFF